jgi:hypothetical protein
VNFFSVSDPYNVKHNYLVIPLNETEYNDLLGQCKKGIPSINISTLMYNGHSSVIAEFGAGSWKQ